MGNCLAHGDSAQQQTLNSPLYSFSHQPPGSPGRAHKEKGQAQNFPTPGSPKDALLHDLSAALPSGPVPRSDRTEARSETSHDDSAYYVIRKTEDVTEVYDIAQELGHGQFGVVSVAVHKATGQHFAIKSMSKRKAEADPRFFKDIRNEVEIMYHLAGHPHVVQLFEVYEDEDTIHLVMDLCQGGDWFGRLIAYGTYSERQAAETVRKLLETLSYCHSLGVVHRDIKPENVLLMHDAPDSAVKLADFGLSAMVPPVTLEVSKRNSSCPKDLLHDAVGSAYYVAPEVLTSNGYGCECDVWSLGVVLYIVLGGYPPFDGENEDKVLRAVVHSPLRFDSPTWELISSSAKDIICRMLCKDPHKRASVPELLSHPWLDPSHMDAEQPLASVASKPASVPDAVVARLQKFAAMNNFKKQARKVLAAFLPEEEVVGLLNIFKAMDSDRNGVLTLFELRAALQIKGSVLPAAKTEELMRCMDLNSDGVIDYEEFLAATVCQIRLDKDELMHKAFRHFDRDHSGFLCKAEIKQALAMQGLEVDADAILEAIDTDCDGRVNYHEFCSCMREEAISYSSRLLRRPLSNRKPSSRKRGLKLINSFSSRPSDAATGPAQPASSSRHNTSRFHPEHPAGAPSQKDGGVRAGTEGMPAAAGPNPVGSGRLPNGSRALAPLPRDHYEAAERPGQLSSIRARHPMTPEDAEGRCRARASGSRALCVTASGRRRQGARSAKPSSRALIRDASSRTHKGNTTKGLHAKPSAVTGPAAAGRGCSGQPATLLLPNCTSCGADLPEPLQRRQTHGGSGSVQSVRHAASCKSSLCSRSLTTLPSVGRSVSGCSMLPKASYSQAWASRHLEGDDDEYTMSLTTRCTAPPSLRGRPADLAPAQVPGSYQEERAE